MGRTAISAVPFRNFNLCPHCQLLGEQPLLSRPREGLPMISRSDGKSFHLLLADRPAPYTPESSSPTTPLVSVCFWYSHISHPQVTNSTMVTLSSTQMNRPALFRTIETIADLLAEALARSGELAASYDFYGDYLFELDLVDSLKA